MSMGHEMGSQSRFSALQALDVSWLTRPHGPGHREGQRVWATLKAHRCTVHGSAHTEGLVGESRTRSALRKGEG